MAALGGLLGIAALSLEQSGRRVEIAAENIANLSTAGYKRRVAFSQILGSPNPRAIASSELASSLDLGPGELRQTANPNDLAIVGDGFFVVATGDQTAYTRSGQFARTADGRLVTAQGFALQSAEGGDLQLRDGAFSVARDGTVTQQGAPVGRVAVVDFSDRSGLTEEGGLLRSAAAPPTPASGASLRQGALEASNVSTADEMVGMMQALRRAEGAQRVIFIYDELMARMLGSSGEG